MPSQEELVTIYKKLKKLLKKYEGKLTPKLDLDSKYDLWSVKDIVISNRQRKEVYFAGLIIQSSYVGLYYMPVYVDTSLKNIFSDRLLTLLKGKSCFHVKKLDKELERDIAKALKAGYDLYKKRGWV